MLRRKKIKIIINGREISCCDQETVLEVAKRNGIKIPNLCYHSDLEPGASCRLCLISIKGKKGVVTACSTKASKGMVIETETEEIKRLRKTNLELLFAQHVERCSTCNANFNCELLDLAKEYGVNINKFTDRKVGYPQQKFGPAILFNSSKCIDCRNCVKMCEKQGVGFLDVNDNNCFFEVSPSKEKDKDCVYCGQCINHCPTGALEEVSSINDVEEALKNKEKFVVFQFAPSIRSSIGEEFGFDYGTVVTGKLISALKELGANKVFDVSFGADITTIEEANELIERVASKRKLPMFTSCCPAWVKFVEFYYPEFIKGLTSVRSPHIILGAVIKELIAKKEKISFDKIVVVSIMPCTAKKFEIERKELEVKGIKPVDYVLTTRELAKLLKKRKIDLNYLKEGKLDDLLGGPSGAGVIFGATGGVTESALRTAIKKLTNKKSKKINFKQVRGMKEVKEAEVKIGKTVLKIAVANGLGNAKIILERLKKNPKLYDYVEVMACSGGCIGGGGQPLPTNKSIRKKRALGLYNVDKGSKIRLADDNPIIKKIYKDLLNNEKVVHRFCHTTYSKKSKDKTPWSK